MVHTPRQIAQLFASAVVATSLLACGGGDEGGSTGPRNSAPPGAGAGGGALAGTMGNGTLPQPNTGAGDFGNSTTPPPNLPPIEGFNGEDCLEATIAFVIDSSGSMCEVFGGSTRWQALRAALVTPNEGLIFRLQHLASFGMLLYSGTVDLALLATDTSSAPAPACAGIGFGTAQECMQLREVPPALNNAPAIEQAFPPIEIGGSTPSDRALNMQVDALIAAQAGRDLTIFPQYIIFATDGQPNDICIGGAGGDGIAQQQAVLQAVDRAAQARITTFVISLAGGDPGLQAHLDEVARHGDPQNPNAVTFNPETPEALTMTLQQLLATALGCNIE